MSLFSSSSSSDDIMYKFNLAALEVMLEAITVKESKMSSSSEQDDKADEKPLFKYLHSLRIPYEEIKSATNDFAKANYLLNTQSSSPFWTNHYYKGQLKQSGGDFVKILARKFSKTDARDWMGELNNSYYLKHTNISSVYKVSTKDDHYVIIIKKYEVNESLDKHLSGSTLTWIQRLHICVRVAHALSHIHNCDAEGKTFIHGNIKSSKILLDENWEPKLHDLRTVMKVEKHHLRLTSKYEGALEYMDPAYEKTHGLTHKSDVFSYGVVLFEVLFGRVASSIPDPDEEDNQYFARLARLHYEEKTLDRLIDPDLRKQMSMNSFNLFSELAYCCLKEQRESRPNIDKVVIVLEEALELQHKHQNAVKASIRLKGKNLDHFKIPLSDILFATNEFSSNNRIGSGGYGMVYKADLDHFGTVAIKRLFNRQDGQGEEGFSTEIELLTNCKHPNIISLLGFCEEGAERILVYEHVSNGSLSDYLKKINYPTSLSWAQRIQICLDIAYGLRYLHSSTEEKQMIIHRDIKSDNILLDDNWVAKIADFGLSKLRSVDQKASTINTVNIAGTQVYLDPEYMKTGKLKKESDIYSLGVVFFEILSGKMAYDECYYVHNEIKGIVSTVRRCCSEGTMEKLVDPNLMEAPEDIFMRTGRLNQQSLDTFFRVAHQCLADTQVERPPMDLVIKELKNALAIQENLINVSHILLEDIKLGTQSFSDDKCIGEGTCWKQYKGEIPENVKGCTVTVVKRFDNSRQGKKQYIAELEVLNKHRHENIISLAGYCNELNEKIILYEHASNGTLDKYLNDASLTWMKRIKICIDIASGLEFLHSFDVLEEYMMIKREIKSGSILLDGDWRARISNWEFSLIETENEKIERQRDGYVIKEDIYSLGVLLVEILSGRPAHPSDKEFYNIIDIKNLVFEGIKEQICPQSLTTYACIAAGCFEDEFLFQSTASDVVRELKKTLEYQQSFIKVPCISLDDIKFGAHNFSNKKCIAEGKCWKKYEVEVQHANGVATFAAKRFDSKSKQGNKQFLVELEVLLEHKHENIIGLAGYCNKINEKIIFYEHAPNGSLDKYLNHTTLTWMKRIMICIDIASGLRSLHEGGVAKKEEYWVMHKYIESSSILLDGDWRAKISNFEFSVVAYSWDSYKHATDNAQGSSAYVNPQDIEDGRITIEIDIYSLGVILLEMLCGRLASGERCEKDHSRSLGPFAKAHYKRKKNLDELVFEGIKEQIGANSLTTFTRVALQCLNDSSTSRPDASKVVLQLRKALEYQVDYEIWEPKLPKDYKEIVQMSKTPDIYHTVKKEDLYIIFSKGILVQQDKVLVSLDENGERNEMISATTFSYINRCPHKWQSLPESRFQKVAEMLDTSNLMIKINPKTQFLSPNIVYGIHLVFKFYDSRNISSKPMYVNLKYKMGRETLHSYFATRRDEEWMAIMLYRFLNEKDGVGFEFLLESLSTHYYGDDVIYIEGIEFRPINDLEHKENAKSKEVQQLLKLHSNVEKVKQLPTISEEIIKESDEGEKLIRLSEVNGKKHLILSARAALDNFSDVRLFKSKISAVSRFGEVVELLPQQVFFISCMITNDKLSPDTDYACYLVFKISKECEELQSPVRVRNLVYRENKETEIIYLISPSPWNLHDLTRVPQQREDGWMEVNLWKFNSCIEVENDVPVNLKLISYEGNLSGLVVCSLEFRPV